MNYEKFVQIMQDDDISGKKLSDESIGDNALAGLNVMAKYLSKSGIGSAEHDIIYADCSIQELIDAGITEADTVLLSELNWMVELEYECLSCFV